MKIVQVDNFAREGPGYDDRFVALVSNPDIATAIVALLNIEHSQAEDPCFYAAVSDDYKLKKFEP